MQNSDDFIALAGSSSVGKASVLHVVRDGRGMDAHVTPIKRTVEYAVSGENQRMYWRGMVLGPIPTHWAGAQQASDRQGGHGGILVITISQDSPLRKQGVCAGTVIRAVAGRPVGSLLDLQTIVNDVPAPKWDVQVDPATVQVAANSKGN